MLSNDKWTIDGNCQRICFCAQLSIISFCSKQLTTILNGLGHCESYDFGLELEKTVTKASDEESTYLTPKIICGEANVVFDNAWDNIIKIKTTQMAQM